MAFSSFIASRTVLFVVVSVAEPRVTFVAFMVVRRTCSAFWARIFSAAIASALVAMSDALVWMAAVSSVESMASLRAATRLVCAVVVNCVKSPIDTRASDTRLSMAASRFCAREVSVVISPRNTVSSTFR